MKKSNVVYSDSMDWNLINDFIKTQNLPVDLDILKTMPNILEKKLPLVSLKLPQNVSVFFYHANETLQILKVKILEELENENFYSEFKIFAENNTELLNEIQQINLEDISSEIVFAPYCFGVVLNLDYKVKDALSLNKVVFKANKSECENLENFLHQILSDTFFDDDSLLSKNISDSNKNAFIAYFVSYFSIYFDELVESDLENLLSNNDKEDENEEEIVILENKIFKFIEEKNSEEEEEGKKEEEDIKLEYSIEIESEIFGVCSELEISLFEEKKSISGKFKDGLNSNTIYEWFGIKNQIKDLPSQVQENNNFISFEIVFEENQFAITLKHPNLQIAILIGKEKAIYFAINKREDIKKADLNTFEEFLDFLHINSFGLLIKNDPKVEVDMEIILPKDSSNSNLNVFSKNFLNEYNIISFAEIEIYSKDEFAIIKDAFKVDKLNAYIAVNTIKGDVKVAAALEIANLHFESFEAESFRLIVQANFSKKEFAFVVEGDFKIKLSDKESLSFYLGGKVSTDSFYITGSLQPNFYLNLTDKLKFSEVGLLLGYSPKDGFDIGFQGRLMVSSDGLSYSVFMAAQFSILGPVVKPKMFSIALAPNTDKPVTLAQLTTTMLSLPDTFPMPPIFKEFGVGDILLKEGNKVNLKQDLPTSGNTFIETQRYIENEFNSLVSSDLSIPKQTAIVNVLGSKSNCHYLISDNQRKLHYRLSYNGALYLNAQFYYCLEDTQIGKNKYPKGIFSAATLSVMGQEFVILFKSDFKELEAYAMMRPLDLWGLLKVTASDNKPKGTNTVTSSSNQIFDLVRTSSQKDVGPEFYIKLNTESLMPLEALLIQGRVSLLNIFTIDTYISLKDSILINTYINLFNLHLDLYFKTSAKDEPIKQIDFSMDFRVDSFSDVITKLRNQVSSTANNLKHQLDNARVSIDDDTWWIAEHERRKKENWYNNLPWYKKAWYCITNFVNDAWNYARNVVNKARNLLIDGIQLLIEVGSYAFNAILSGIEKLVSLLGNLVRINKFFVKASSSFDTNKRDYNFKFKSELDVDVFNRKFNPRFDLDINFNNLEGYSFVSIVGNKLYDELLWRIKDTDQYKALGLKDEDERPTFEFPSDERVKLLIEHTDSSLSKIQMSEEYVNFFKDLMNDPIALEEFFTLNEATLEDRENIMNVLQSNLIDPSAPLENLVSLFEEDEFKNAYQELKVTVNSNSEFNQTHREVIQNMDLLMNSVSQSVKEAKILRDKIHENRAKDRYKRDILYNNSEIKKQEIRKKAIIKQLRNGTSLDFVSLGSDEIFLQIIRDINEPEIMELAMNALNEFYENKK